MGKRDAHVANGIMDSLAARRRRLILEYMLTAETERFSLDELVDHVVDEETHSPVPDRETVAASLYHAHVPKLAERGLVEYDAERGIVAPTDRMTQIEPFLNPIRESDSQDESENGRE